MKYLASAIALLALPDAASALSSQSAPQTRTQQGASYVKGGKAFFPEATGEGERVVLGASGKSWLLGPDKAPDATLPGQYSNVNKGVYERVNGPSPFTQPKEFVLNTVKTGDLSGLAPDATLPGIASNVNKGVYERVNGPSPSTQHPKFALNTVQITSKDFNPLATSVRKVLGSDRAPDATLPGISSNVNKGVYERVNGPSPSTQPPSFVVNTVKTGDLSGLAPDATLPGIASNVNKGVYERVNGPSPSTQPPKFALNTLKTGDLSGLAPDATLPGIASNVNKGVYERVNGPSPTTQAPSFSLNTVKTGDLSGLAPDATLPGISSNVNKGVYERVNGRYKTRTPEMIVTTPFGGI